MRGVLAAVLACVCMSAPAAPGVPTKAVESTGLRSIAGWLKSHGVEGFLGADVADAIGIARAENVELIAARQRGFREDEVLRIAQLLEGQLLLFMVQAPGEAVRFYLSTTSGEFRKGLISSGGVVAPLGGAQAQAEFRQEVLYWQNKVGGE